MDKKSSIYLHLLKMTLTLFFNHGIVVNHYLVSNTCVGLFLVLPTNRRKNISQTRSFERGKVIPN